MSTEVETTRDPQPPVPDPGFEEHETRFSDVDTAAGDRAYRQIVGMLGAVPVLVLVFLVVYFAVPKDAEMVLFGAPFQMQSVLLGFSAGLAALLIGVACVQWARLLMDDTEIAGPRHPAASTPEAREKALTELELGIEGSGIRRRKLIGTGLAGALVAQGGGALSRRGIDRTAEMNRNVRVPIEQGARWVAERAKRLPPLSAFGRRGGAEQGPRRSAVGMR